MDRSAVFSDERSRAYGGLRGRFHVYFHDYSWNKAWINGFFVGQVTVGEV